MQTTSDSPINQLFTKQFSDPFEDSMLNMCCRCIFVNALKHYLTEEWIICVIKKYKTDTLTFMIITPHTEVATERLIVLNDDNVNRLFGWALYQMKKKYKKLIL